MRRTRIKPRYVELMPPSLEEGVLYISKKFSTAAHKCCCGCGTKIVTPLKPTDWVLTESRAGVSLDPSIGNWNHPCQSHYVIRRNRVVWAGRMTKAEINYGRSLSDAAKHFYYGRRVDARNLVSPLTPFTEEVSPQKKKGWWTRIIQWFLP